MADKTMVLTEAGLKTLATELLKVMANSVENRIVDSISATSDTSHVPNAKRVYETYKDCSKVVFVVVPEGKTIDDLDIDKDPTIIYVVRKTLDDTSGVAYIYVNEFGFVKLGSVGGTSGTDDNCFDALDSDTIKGAVADAALDVPNL